jgi:hypothetical protein
MNNRRRTWIAGAVVGVVGSVWFAAPGMAAAGLAAEPAATTAGSGASQESGPPGSLFLDRYNLEVLNLPEDVGTSTPLERVWEPDSAPILDLRYGPYYVEAAGRNLILTRISTSGSSSDEVEFVDFSLLVANPFGGYDIAGRLHITQWKGEWIPRQLEEMEETLAQWRRGEYDPDAVDPQAWIPFTNRNVIEILDRTYNTGDALEPIAETLLAADPDTPLHQVLAIDAAVLEKDTDTVRKRLDRFGEALASSGQPFLDRTPKYYREWLENMQLDRAGKNFYSDLKAIMGDLDSGTFLSLNKTLERLKSIAPATILFRPDQGTILRWETLPSDFLILQVLSKVFRAEADFRLIQGHAGEALELLLPVHRMAMLLTGQGQERVLGLIGRSVRGITIKGLENVYLNGFRDTVALKAAWPALERVLQEDREVSNAFAKADKTASEAYLSDRDAQELDTRNWVAHMRLALVHSGAAVRYRILAGMDYPEDARDFGPLLPDGADLDAFADFEKPLRIARYDDRPFVLYSVGPDREDQGGRFSYDPTNGTISPGDLYLDVPRARMYPFPPPWELATTRDGVLAQFPNGLPPDPFANSKSCSYAITDTEPAWILSWGPDTDQSHWVDDYESIENQPDFSDLPPKQREFMEDFLPRVQEKSFEAIPGAGYGVSTVDGRYYRYRNLIPGVHYDPTNGTVSDGNLYFSTADPEATILRHNLPPTPTPLSPRR